METEKSMRELILSDIQQFTDNAHLLEEDNFVQDVYSSFQSALSNRHYVLLVPVDLDMYYSEEQHHAFEKNGYCREGSQERFMNIFFAPMHNMEQMTKVLKKEEMCIDIVREEKTNDSVYVVTINGIKDSNYISDYQNKTE